MSANRIADLQLRGSTSPLPVRVYWPARRGPRPGPLLVFCMVGAGADTRAEATCQSLSADLGVVVLAVSCVTDAQDGTTVLEWAAEHAAELGGDPGRLLVAGQGPGSLIATAVAAQAQAARWPAVTLVTGHSGTGLSEAVRHSLSAAER